MRSCQYHREYDPDCVCCWQVRAKWLDAYRKSVDKDWRTCCEIIETRDERIAELEKQLAEVYKESREGWSNYRETELQRRALEKREVVLRVKVEYCKTHHELPEQQQEAPDSWAGGKGKVR